MSRAPEPFVIPAAALGESDVDPASAPPPPDEPPTGAAMVRMAELAARPPRGGGWLWPTAGALVSMMIGIAAWDYVTRLLARSEVLGTAVLLLMGLFALLLLGQVARELLAMRKLARIDAFRAEASAVTAAADARAAAALAERLARFYGGRPELQWSRDTLAAERAHLLDPDAILAVTERHLLEPLDNAARREIEAAARTVAAATAVVPLALVDVMAAASQNIRMIRRIAEIYGAHAGLLGSLRLLREVATHLLATGAVAVGDDLIGSVAGGHLAARLSRRFGEGVVNGALTARVGVAAMDVCRPLPFVALPRPRVSNLIGRALTGLFGKG
ncbi:TIGR01620 family protein [Amaricoccus sp.]|uniref:TIGR01620 family protein n=1 Tax=Amaricoccus sp. TaxID=1872485 RepID=UPI001B3CA498|nr:TIGR01620 family protein [Amaricoccus sp.]MBP7241390.1 TIGR01620 family protein [Amaricoccus sp.]